MSSSEIFQEGFSRLRIDVRNFLKKANKKTTLLSKCLFQIHNSFKIPVTQIAQPAFTCSQLTIETLEQGVKCVQS